jgi:hypothetical protein
VGAGTMPRPRGAAGGPPDAPVAPLPPQIAGLSVNEALAQMAFSAKKRGSVAATAVRRAVWNADFYHDVKQDDLMVTAAWTGKELSAPRVRYHGRGRVGMMHYRTSKLTVMLREMTPAEREERAKFARWQAPTPELRASLDPRGY